MKNAVLSAAVVFAAMVSGGVAVPVEQAKAASSQLSQMTKQLQAGLGASVDQQTREVEVDQLKALLGQIDQDHGRHTPEAKIEKEAKAVLQTLEQTPGQVQQKQESSSEESSSEESSSSSSNEESSEESSKQESSQPAKSMRQLEQELAELMAKKSTGTVRGDDLEALNVQIELILNKIKELKGMNKPSEESSEESKPARNEVERLVDPILAHLANLREGKGDFAILHQVDVDDLSVNMRKLADLADAYKSGGARPCQATNSCEAPKPACQETDSCGNPVVAPEIKDPCAGEQCEKKIIVEAEEKKCGDEPCHAPQMTVVAQTKCASNAAQTSGCAPAAAPAHQVNPVVVDKCNPSAGACAAQSKSATSTCAPCQQQRDACHSACQQQQSCHDACHQQHDACHVNKCDPSVVRVDTVSPTTQTTTSCQASSTNGACQNVKPTMVQKGELSDKKAAKFFFF